jgi:diguanylate cyclase (GGDEF)-like protein
MIERDRLTGVFNQTSFRDRLSRELERCKRSGVELSLAILDVDHFKQVNDAHGHGVGDMVLRALVGTLQSKLRRIDIVGRLGGEEFGILLPDTDAKAAASVVDRLRIEFRRQSFEAGTHAFGVSFSAGIACSRGFDDVMLAMMNGADEALYQAKRQGRDCVVIA